MIDRAWRGDRQKHRWQKQDWKVSLSVCYYGKAEKICVGEMLKVSGIEISRRILRLALSRLSMPEETGQKPVNPTVLCTILDYICPCLTLLLFFIFLLHSSSLPFVCFQLHHQNKHIIRGLVDGSEQVVTFFLKSFASRDFPLHLCHCHMPPFFLCSSLFSALCRFLCHHIWQSALMTQHPLICF